MNTTNSTVGHKAHFSRMRFNTTLEPRDSDNESRLATLTAALEVEIGERMAEALDPKINGTMIRNESD